MRWYWRRMPLVHAMVLGSACGVTDTERPPVGAVVVTPDAIELPAGGTAAFDVQVTDAAGNVLRDRRVVWASADPSIAAVSDRGVVTGMRPGRVEVAATAEGKSGLATVSVVALPARVTSVRIEPDHLDLFVAASANLVATGYDSRGAPVDGRSVVWTTNNATVAAVSQSGRVTGLVPGSAVITAVIDGAAGNATVVVRLVPVASVAIVPSDLEIDAGKSAALTARVTDAAGNTLTGREVSWSSADTRIVTVDHSGVVRGVRRGAAVITAAVEGRFGRATVRVR